MKKLFIFIRLVVFFTIMFALIIVLGKVFTPKWKNGTLSEMDGQDYTINGYYELPKNSIDVLFLGDSSIFKGVSPMEIYEQTGITTEYLTEEDILKLTTGIIIFGKENLTSTIEYYE